jgi:hypothetical protein
MKDKLSVVIGTCDLYSPLWKNFDILYKKYWNVDTRNIFVGETNPILYEGYENILPGNNLPWGYRMLQGINEVKTEYVCLLLEDYYFTEPITKKFIEEHISILEKYSAQKIMFDKLYPPDVYTLKQLENDLFLFDKNSQYLNSVQPAIWKTEYLKDVLKPSYSPWNFEVEGNGYTSMLNPTVLLKAREESVYFNFSRIGGRISEGWEKVFEKEGLKL